MDFQLLLHTCNTRVIFSQFHHRYILCKFNNQTDSLPDGSPIKQFHTDWTNELTFADLIEVNMLCPSQATREVTCASLFFFISSFTFHLISSKQALASSWLSCPSTKIQQYMVSSQYTLCAQTFWLKELCYER